MAASGATQWVSVSGADSSTCGAKTSPCKTIQYTVSNRVASGDAIAIFPGIYAENVSIFIDLTLIGSGPAKTFIDGSNQGTVLTSGNVLVRTSVTIANLTIQHGAAATGFCGGGIANYSTMLLFRVTVTGSTGGQGGGICNSGPPMTMLTISQSTISSNSAVSGGGGIENGASLAISESTLNSNRSPYGGAISNNDFATITNSTLTGNTALDGGAIYNGNELRLMNCTITNNNAQTAGGIETPAFFGLTFFSNTILSGNHATSASPDCGGTDYTSEDYNLIGTTSGCSITPGPHDIVGAAVLLGPLQNNGGPTLTMRPMSGSPAIDGGNPRGCEGEGTTLTYDQRLAPRNVPCDVGSVEIQK
jgi:hypothetical protein